MEHKQVKDSHLAIPFYERPQVETHSIPVGKGVTFGFERIFHPEIGIGGTCGTWGDSYDNESLLGFIENQFGEPLSKQERINLSPLGFDRRHHIPNLSAEEHLELEVEVGARFLREAAKACGWKPEEVEGVFVGMTGPISDDYTERIAERAGIPRKALKLSIHKACDSSMGALQLLLNPDLPIHQRLNRNIAQEMYGKKVLVGGIEGLSRIVKMSWDKTAVQLFGNGAGIIGVIPGQTMSFLVGKAHEVFDEKGVLEIAMSYPHSGKRENGQSMLEVSRAGENHLRIAGFMHEPEGGEPVVMAGPMGMVKLFVRSGVEVVSEVIKKYQNLMDEMGLAKELTLGIVHHANLKINKLKAKRLNDFGINVPMPWTISDLGNVSAASNIIAFLRQLSKIKSGDHILFDGFGAGTYYDTFAVALGDHV